MEIIGDIYRELKVIFADQMTISKNVSSAVFMVVLLVGCSQLLQYVIP